MVYLEKGSFAQRLRNLMPKFYSTKSSIYHYLHMAKGNYREYLKREKVRVKKYFYVLRPILVCMWIATRKTMPPMEFAQLLHAQKFDKKLADEIERLLDRKRAGEELDLEERIVIINRFLEEKIKCFEGYVKTLKGDKPEQDQILDDLFKVILKENNNTFWGQPSPK